MKRRRKGVLAQFDKEIKDITDRRAAVYGHPADDFGRLAKMAEGIKDCKDPLLRHCMFMILAKVARLAETPDHLDSWVDVVGYARCAVMILDRRTKPKEKNLGARFPAKKGMG